MKKIYLSVLAFYIGILQSFSQTVPADSAAYKSRKLGLEEINFVSGYYRQDGDHSAVTGGVGTEKLTDFANTIELRVFKYDKRLRRNSFSFELGIDHYSSASSDKIDPNTISSASSSDTRIYPSLGWSRTNEQKHATIGLNTSFSNEFDYKSVGIGATIAKASPDNNRELSVHVQAYFDKWSVIYPVELRPILGGNTGSGKAGEEPRNSFSTSFMFSQVVNQKLQLLYSAEPTYQTGQLATRYQRVYFTDGTESVETLPDTRFKLPLGIRANYFPGGRFIIRSFYRFYLDNWGLTAHTMELEAPYKLTPFISLSPFYRFYAQNAIDYFAPYQQHQKSEPYYSSDYDLSKFMSHYFGANFRTVPANGVFGIKKFSTLELRYGHYLRSNGLNSDQLSLSLQFK